MDAKVTTPITRPATAEDIYQRSVGTIPERVRDLERNQSACGCFVAGILVLLAASFVEVYAEANRVRSEIKQLELDRDLLRMTVYGTNEAVSKELRRINQHTGMSRFEWNAGGAE